MIQRFNFYDVYGYFIPGITLILVVWLPFALLEFPWPGVDMVVIAVVVGYIIGHFIQSMGNSAIPEQVRIGSIGRFSSTLLLNPSNPVLDQSVKRRISMTVMSWFGIDIAINKEADDAIARARDEAFLMCRRIVNASSSYSEQHQALYALMKGLTLAFGFGACYTLGWLLSAWSNSVYDIVLGSLFAVGLLGTVMVPLVRAIPALRPARGLVIERFALCSAAFAMAAGGYFLGRTYLLDDASVGWLTVEGVKKVNVGWTLCVLLALYCAAMLRFFSSYRYFADQFAISVWRHFAAEPIQRPAK